MALWHLLVLSCFGMALGAALVPARVANAGLAGYLVCGATGIAVGAGCAWLMWLMHKGFRKWMFAFSGREKQTSRQEWYARAFYFSKLVWIGFVAALAYYSSSALLRLFR